MESNNLLTKIELLENDSKKIETIEHLQHAFDKVRSSYSVEYNSLSNDVINTVKARMKQNPYMQRTVQYFVNNYVIDSLKEQATEELYNMLSAEVVLTFQTLSHTSCTVL